MSFYSSKYLTSCVATHVTISLQQICIWTFKWIHLLFSMYHFISIKKYKMKRGSSLIKIREDTSLKHIVCDSRDMLQFCVKKFLWNKEKRCSFSSNLLSKYLIGNFITLKAFEFSWLAFCFLCATHVTTLSKMLHQK